LLVRQKPTFSLDAASVTGESAIGADDAVAWHDDSDRVRAVGEPHCSDSPWLADSPRELPVGTRLAAGDFAKRLPYRSLEPGARRGHRQVFDRRQVAGKVGEERRRQPARVRRRREGRSSLFGVEAKLPTQARVAGIETNGSKAPLLVGYESEPADGSLQVIKQKGSGLHDD
jgi:hypothetical protein